ncbi:MAG: efflux RND transporter periplasmic adaptor subunit [Acidimicrobiia bacterium]
MPIAALLVVALLWWFVGRSDGASENTAAPQQVVTVSRATMSETVSADGTVAADQTDDLSFTASGTVTEVNVKAGDTVTAGQMLAKIDSAELEAAVASAESDLADAQAKLADDEDAGASDEQISADETSVTAAEDSVTNANEDLAGASLVAGFDGTVASVDLTVGEVLGSGGTGGSDLTGTDSGSGQSSFNLGSGNTQGPAIGGASDDSSSDSSSSTPQIQVVSTGRYTVEVNVDTSDVDAINVGQAARLTVSSSSGNASPFGGGAFPGGGGVPGGGNFPGLGGNGGNNAGSGSGNQGQGSGSTTDSDSASATGTVTAVSEVADASSGVASYPVTISFDADSREFFVGSNVTAEITTAERENVLQVSSAAVTTSNGQSTVEIATNGTANGPTETRTVETGMSSGGMVEITSGLEEGEKVVITLRVPGAGNSGGGNLPDFGSGGFPGAPAGGAGSGG